MKIKIERIKTNLQIIEGVLTTAGRVSTVESKQFFTENGWYNLDDFDAIFLKATEIGNNNFSFYLSPDYDYLLLNIMAEIPKPNFIQIGNRIIALDKRYSSFFELSK